ncbi:DUF2933 domain-containing protein [Neptunomonas qingdaonensis]|uniref:DUF2933 domain-containing protein n=1 Tax=Neptunomonas qingdaonensis TaxID=1045558 RepID=A0A1I2SSB5_9GAMM|nr:DUF2933 domain-containing protein [Neptunomonas qingdaonensis]SFG53026.1 Protein of unknown function [Neptunomonas qingdaonensis]
MFSFWKTPWGLATLALSGAATYFLVVEHQQHIFAFLPFLIFLACPLMHLFMHKKHRHGHNKHEEHEESKDIFQKGVEEGKRQSLISNKENNRE